MCGVVVSLQLKNQKLPSVVVVLLSCGRAIVLCYPGLGQICDCSKGKKSKAARCGVVVWWWCGGVVLLPIIIPP